MDILSEEQKNMPGRRPWSALAILLCLTLGGGGGGHTGNFHVMIFPYVDAKEKGIPQP